VYPYTSELAYGYCMGRPFNWSKYAEILPVLAARVRLLLK